MSSKHTLFLLLKSYSQQYDKGEKSHHCGIMLHHTYLHKYQEEVYGHGEEAED